jgi:hypothetical protein
VNEWMQSVIAHELNLHRCSPCGHRCAVQLEQVASRVPSWELKPGVDFVSHGL